MAVFGGFHPLLYAERQRTCRSCGLVPLHELASEESSKTVMRAYEMIHYDTNLTLLS